MFPEPLARILSLVRHSLPENQKIYLVGGAVRDALMGRSLQDLDFGMVGDTLAIARKVSTRLKADFFVLDDVRRMARVIYHQPGGEPLYLDFVLLADQDIMVDLSRRDFTLNAMAIDLDEPGVVIDPLGGQDDIHQRLLKVCSPQSLINDPIRILRGIRMAVEFALTIPPDTWKFIQGALGGIPRTSPERQRDELFKILDGSHPEEGIRLLKDTGSLAYILPELVSLIGEEQSLPHVLNVWEHTLSGVQYLSSILSALEPGAASIENEPRLGYLWQQLTRFNFNLVGFLKPSLTAGRSHRALLLFTMLYHDVGKPGSRSMDGKGHIHNYGHEQIGGQVAAQRGRELMLSANEVDRIQAIIRNHMRVHQLSQEGTIPSRQAIYRFFRDTGEAGIDICLLSLADINATFGPTLPPDRWISEVNTVQHLLAAWWDKPEESVRPPVLVDGHQLQIEFGLTPGPLIGRLLGAIREAQATGLVADRAGALAFARELIASKGAKDANPER